MSQGPKNPIPDLAPTKSTSQATIESLEKTYGTNSTSVSKGEKSIYGALSKLVKPKNGDFKFSNSLRNGIFAYLSPQQDLNENEGVKDLLTHSQKLALANAIKILIAAMPGAETSDDKQSVYLFIENQIDDLKKVIETENAQRQATFTTITAPQSQTIKFEELPNAQNATKLESESDILKELLLSEDEANEMLAKLGKDDVEPSTSPTVHVATSEADTAPKQGLSPSAAPVSSPVKSQSKASNNPGGVELLVDVDGTLLIGEEYNDALIDSMLKKGIKEIYLCTSMSISDKSSRNKEKSRADLIKHLEGKGIVVKGVHTNTDLFFVNHSGDNKKLLKDDGTEVPFPTAQAFLDQKPVDRKGQEIPETNRDSLLRSLGIDPTKPENKDKVVQAIQLFTEQYDEIMQTLEQPWQQGQLYTQFISKYEAMSPGDKEKDPGFHALAFISERMLSKSHFNKMHQMFPDIDKKNTDITHYEKQQIAMILQDDAKANGRQIKGFIALDDNKDAPAQMVKGAQPGTSAAGIIIKPKDNYDALLDKAFQTVNPTNLLDLGKYIALNSATWVAPEALDNPPQRWDPKKKDEDSVRTTTVRRVIAGTLQLSDDPVITQTLQRGNGYAYPKSGVQGLTPVSTNPLLFSTMAPDQYILPHPGETLDAKTISALSKILSQDPEIQFKIENDEELKKLIIRDSIYTTTPGSALFSILAKYDIKHSNALQDALMIPLNKFIGNRHIEATKKQLNSPYAVLSIVKPNMTEVAGYDLSSKPLAQSKHIVEQSNLPSLTEYESQADNSPLKRQMVMQSQTGDSKLCITGTDMEHLIEFYDNTVAKQIPLVVHCMDGIDRTGIMITALSILHQYKSGSDITEKPLNEQQQILLNLRESLRQDRGPNFLRLPEDAARGVILGYLLIATQKQINFEKELKFDNANLNGLLGKVKNKEIEPNDLNIQLASFNEKLSDSDQAKVEEWKTILKQRISAQNQFDTANRDTTAYAKDLAKASQSFNASSDLNRNTTPIERADIKQYNDIINEGKYDITSYKDKNGQGIYHYATQTLLANPTGENLKQMAKLLKNGKITAHLAVEEKLKSNNMDPRIIGMALQISEDKKQGVKAIKRELQSLTPEEKVQLKAQIKALSKNGDKESKKIFKQLESALPKRSLQTKIRDKLNFIKPIAKAEAIPSAPAAVPNQPVNQVVTPPVDKAELEAQANKANTNYLKTVLTHYIELQTKLIRFKNEKEIIPMEKTQANIDAMKKNLDKLRADPNKEISQAADNINTIINDYTLDEIKEIKSLSFDELDAHVKNKETVRRDSAFDLFQIAQEHSLSEVQPQPASSAPVTSSTPVTSSVPVTPAVSKSAALTQEQLDDTLKVIEAQLEKAQELVKKYPEKARHGGRVQVFAASSNNEMTTFARRFQNILNFKISNDEYAKYHLGDPQPQDKWVEDVKKNLVALKNDIETKHPNSDLAKAVRSCIEEVNKPVQKQEAHAGKKASL